MFHIFGLNINSLLVLHAGGKVAMLPGFAPETFVTALEQHKPSFLHCVPPLAQFCAYDDRVKPEHLESVEYIMIGAAPVGDALAKAFKEKAPHCQFREGEIDLWLFWSKHV